MYMSCALSLSLSLLFISLALSLPLSPAGGLPSIGFNLASESRGSRGLPTGH